MRKFLEWCEENGITREKWCFWDILDTTRLPRNWNDKLKYQYIFIITQEVSSNDPICHDIPFLSPEALTWNLLSLRALQPHYTIKCTRKESIIFSTIVCHIIEIFKGYRNFETIRAPAVPWFPLDPKSKRIPWLFFTAAWQDVAAASDFP